MGKRGRRKARESEDAARLATSQHMARVNVEEEWWKAFRMEAVRTNTSVAAYLGSLVRREVTRVNGRDSCFQALQIQSPSGGVHPRPS